MNHEILDLKKFKIRIFKNAVHAEQTLNTL